MPRKSSAVRERKKGGEQRMDRGCVFRGVLGRLDIKSPGHRQKRSKRKHERFGNQLNDEDAKQAFFEFEFEFECGLVCMSAEFSLSVSLSFSFSFFPRAQLWPWVVVALVSMDCTKDGFLQKLGPTSKNPVMKLLGNRLSPLKFSSLK